MTTTRKMHFNPANGKWGVCSAKDGNCYMVKDDNPGVVHSTNLEDQQKISEEWNQKHFGREFSLRKSVANEDSQKIDEHIKSLINVIRSDSGTIIKGFNYRKYQPLKEISSNIRKDLGKFKKDGLLGDSKMTVRKADNSIRVTVSAFGDNRDVYKDTNDLTKKNMKPEYSKRLDLVKAVVDSYNYQEHSLSGDSDSVFYGFVQYERKIDD